MAILVDYQIDVVDGTGGVMSDDVGDIGVEGDFNDDDSDSGCVYDGGKMTLHELLKIEYPRLKQMYHHMA